MKTLPDDKRAKLNELYREVLQESGKRVTDLPHSEEISEKEQKPKEAVDSEVWRDLCAKRGYLFGRQNPRGF